MKKIFIYFTLIIAALTVCAKEKTVIRISTDKTDLVLQVGDNGRLYQTYLGDRLLHDEDVQTFDWSVHSSSDGSNSRRGWEVCSASGNEDYFEPALNIVHADGNRTTYLYYKDSEQHSILGGAATETTITLADNKYPVNVTLHYIAYKNENIIKTWSEISHSEKAPVTLLQYYTTMLYFNEQEYYLTEFSSDWANEAKMYSQQLQFGKKIVDTKLGSRANLLCQPFFEVGIGAPVQECNGKVLMGTIAWVGNWRYTLEVDGASNLRILPGINPYASDYQLQKNVVFKTPEFIFTLSSNGTSEGSRSFHDWARRYQLKDGMGSRLTLLNNWENTYFNFTQESLASFMHEANKLGVDMFLLDDGWFGNGDNARNDDHAGLGDWEVNHKKLPGGVAALCDSAKNAGVKFGIWIEPEMVNPRSELFKNHPEWVIMQPNREPYYFRNQLVLDMSNPKVQDYAFGIIDKLMKENPDLAFFKWDCNSPITNIYSPYLKGKQGHLYIEYARGVQSLMARVAEAYPNVQMMLCSGGGGRCDYESMKYFTEFWPSDDTNPVERIFIQWGFSQFFPAKAMCAHVTSWNRQTSIKFRTDVASMCKLGFDIGLRDMNSNELAFCQNAIANWKRLTPAIMDGNQYRLVSPYDGNHMAVNYVSQDRSSAVLFAYDIHPRFNEKITNVRLQGLDPMAKYLVKEINLMPSTRSTLREDGKVYSGDYLMKIGINALTQNQCNSRVIELTKVSFCENASF